MLNAQSLYFPPKVGNIWESQTPASLGWNQNGIDSLYSFLDSHDTKAFIVLKNGKIVLENYFGTFTADSLWYWASAGKTLTSLLMGIAQEEGFLNIEDSSSRWLGTGWTSCTPQQEAKIRVRHHLMMSTGLNDNVPDDNCETDTCLFCIADTGNRWAYHNAPYLRLQDVIAIASGMPYQNFTHTRLKLKTGMTGFWYDKTYYSRARDMARFGLLILNQGIWASDTVLKDSDYFQAMVNSSQNLNPSYGYLWWLNGKGSHMIPDIQYVVPTDLIPAAPDDCIAALGKNDQKLYVVPSEGLVVVRMGNTGNMSHLSIQSFDNGLWNYLRMAMGLPKVLSLSGQVSMGNTFSSPLDSVLIFVSDSMGMVVDTVLTDMFGSFIFPELSAGVYTLELNIPQAWGGVNATDCLLILKHFVNLDTLTGIALKAADVSGDTQINSIDALLSARRFTGSISAFPAGDWVTDPLEFELNESLYGLEIKTLCFGDVNASFIPLQ